MTSAANTMLQLALSGVKATLRGPARTISSFYEVRKDTGHIASSLQELLLLDGQRLCNSHVMLGAGLVHIRQRLGQMKTT